jgi:hypothetical protein
MNVRNLISHRSCYPVKNPLYGVLIYIVAKNPVHFGGRVGAFRGDSLILYPESHISSADTSASVAQRDLAQKTSGNQFAIKTNAERIMQSKSPVNEVIFAQVWI